MQRSSKACRAAFLAHFIDFGPRLTRKLVLAYPDILPTQEVQLGTDTLRIRRVTAIEPVINELLCTLGILVPDITPTQ